MAVPLRNGGSKGRAIEDIFQRNFFSDGQNSDSHLPREGGPGVLRHYWYGNLKKKLLRLP